MPIRVLHGVRFPPVRAQSVVKQQRRVHGIDDTAENDDESIAGIAHLATAGEASQHRAEKPVVRPRDLRRVPDIAEPHLEPRSNSGGQ